MKAATRNRGRLAALVAACLLPAAGCADDDACKGRGETCLSLTLSGSDGVVKVDQVQVYLSRKEKPASPLMALSDPRELPFKVAVLWPDGPGTIYLRTYLGGQLNGLTPELSMDLRNGQHERRKLTLFSPLSGTGPVDMAGGPPPRDMSSPRDMTSPADMTDPADMANPVDMGSVPDSGPPDMPMMLPDMPTLRAAP